MRAKKGMVVWSYFVFEGKVELQEWVLRTIRTIKRNFLPDEKRAFFVQKNKHTWVKLSKKHFDYGWAKNIDSLYRRDVDLNKDDLPHGLYSTKLQAAKAALEKEEKDLKNIIQYRCSNDSRFTDVSDSEWEEWIKEGKRDVQAAKRNLTRVKNTRKK